MAALELQYLKEINRISAEPNDMLTDLEARVGLRLCQESFSKIAELAICFGWTRDPFDRIIVAQADVGGGKLITKDETIRANFQGAIWD